MICSLVRFVLLLAALGALAGTTASASIIVTWSDVGSDLVGTWSGSWDLSGYGGGSESQVINAEARILAPAGPVMLSQPTTGRLPQYTKFHNYTIPISFSAFNGIATGDPFQMSGGNPLRILDVPPGYVTNSPLSGTMTFSNSSISSVFGTQLNAGPVVVMSDGVSGITFQVVPEPATVVLAAGAAAAWAIRRARISRRQQAQG
jgi:hypothetical protein